MITKETYLKRLAILKEKLLILTLKPDKGLRDQIEMTQIVHAIDLIETELAKLE